MNTLDEIARLEPIVRALIRIPPARRTGLQKAELYDYRQKLRELLAIPAPGYELPLKAAELIEYARHHGWQATARWQYGPKVPEPFVTVGAARGPEPGPNPEPGWESRQGWELSYTWHSRGCGPGKLRLHGRGVLKVPGRPLGRGGSVRDALDLINRHTLRK
ncbi:hypothetical protein ACIRBX_12075 [Kitasatospora sp. NPDC096147]|uniref:hypothetical protein n=1 Tax=Kitasatospora sp. NPDC096147 TaxID=3364093 RepID=UPI00380D52BB